MRASFLSVVGFVGLVSVFASAGCSSAPSAAEVTASCNGYCDKYAAAACEVPTYVDANECKAEECGDYSSFSDDCREAFKDFYDCQQAQSNANICADAGCENQAISVLSNCLLL